MQGSLKRDAEMAVRRAAGVDTVVNRIVLLSASIHDDRIRWATYYRIYTDDSRPRYGPGDHEVRREQEDERHFPGMQPVGRYPIHIVVQHGRTMLLGAVDSITDRQLVELRAREVTGVFGVDNGLVVAPD